MRGKKWEGTLEMDSRVGDGVEATIAKREQELREQEHKDRVGTIVSRRYSPSVETVGAASESKAEIASSAPEVPEPKTAPADAEPREKHSTCGTIRKTQQHDRSQEHKCQFRTVRSLFEPHGGQV